MDINLIKLNSFSYVSIFWHKPLEAQAEKCILIFNIGKAVILNCGNEGDLSSRQVAGKCNAICASHVGI